MRFFGWHIDFIGFSASFACAVHCMALPLVLSMGMFGGATWLENELVEALLILGSIAIASYSIGRSYFKDHKKLKPVIWVLLGVLFLLFSLGIHSHSEATHYLMAIGGFAIAYAHYINWRLLSSCKVPSPSFSK